MDLKRACLLVFIAIFNRESFVEIDGKRFFVHYFKHKAVKFVDVKLNGTKFRFIEQNRRKASKYGKMAKEGHKILWVLREGEYHARMIDGEFELM
ncbi:MAG: hypothetical protein ACTSU5_02330 [Promethearchaeota archaeon]